MDLESKLAHTSAQLVVIGQPIDQTAETTDSLQVSAAKH
jgi:hypothetical protein